MLVQIVHLPDLALADQGKREIRSLNRELEGQVARSILSPNVRVNSWAKVEDSILFEGVDVGRHASFVAEIRRSELKTSRMGGRLRRLLEVEVSDATGSLLLKWFRSSDRMAETLAVGARLLVTGDVRRYRFRKEIVHPEIELIDRGGDEEDPAAALAAQRRIVPEYATPECDDVVDLVTHRVGLPTFGGDHPFDQSRRPNSSRQTGSTPKRSLCSSMKSMQSSVIRSVT